jgi:hypothetical protein
MISNVDMRNRCIENGVCSSVNRGEMRMRSAESGRAEGSMERIESLCAPINSVTVRERVCVCDGHTC